LVYFSVLIPNSAQVPAYATATEMHPLVPGTNVLEQPHPSPRPRAAIIQINPDVPATGPPSAPSFRIPPADEDNPPSYDEALTMPSAPLQEELVENSQRSKIRGKINY